MSKKPRVNVEIFHDNYEPFIRNFSFYATVVAPAMLFWLDLLEGKPDLPDLKVSQVYRITALSADRHKQKGQFDVTYFNESLGERNDYRLIFDFSDRTDFQPAQIRQTVTRALANSAGDQAWT